MASLYGRLEISASNTSATAITLAHSGISSPESPAGYPFPDTFQDSLHPVALAQQTAGNPARQDLEQRIPGIYLMLRPQVDRKQQASLSVSYVTTLGSAINTQLRADSTFQVPTGFDNSATRQIAAPVQGTDELLDQQEESTIARYYMTTNDRLVTPADIKLFCYTELQSRYGLDRKMIKSVTVSHRQQRDRWNAGYEILVEIVLNDSLSIRRGFEDKLSQTEAVMRAMMSVRSANIYPIQVTIQIDKNK